MNNSQRNVLHSRYHSPHTIFNERIFLNDLDPVTQRFSQLSNSLCDELAEIRKGVGSIEAVIHALATQQCPERSATISALISDMNEIMHCEAVDGDWFEVSLEYVEEFFRET